MAQTVASADERSWRYVVWILGGAVALAALLRFAAPTRIPGLANFGIVFGSLLIEAVPFVLAGALVSALIEVFAPPRYFAWVAGVPRALQLPLCGLAGLALPVCECGSIPVARRLMAKGLPPGGAVTFMLAAPVLNPVVVASTIVAYRGRAAFWPMVLGRAGLGLAVSVAVGWALGGAPSHNDPGVAGDSHHEIHASRTIAFFDHLASDFVFMARYLVLGATFAAALQTFVAQSFVASVADIPLLDLVAMLALAFVLSLCSESDAFVAASFVQFGVGAQLAFLVFGPMVDSKLAVLYTGTFGRSFARSIVIVAAAATIAGALWMEVLFG